MHGLTDFVEVSSYNVVVTAYIRGSISPYI